MIFSLGGRKRGPQATQLRDCARALLLRHDSRLLLLYLLLLLLVHPTQVRICRLVCQQQHHHHPTRFLSPSPHRNHHRIPSATSPYFSQRCTFTPASASDSPPPNRIDFRHFQLWSNPRIASTIACSLSARKVETLWRTSLLFQSRLVSKR